MRIPSWRTVAALTRMNRGKPSLTELANQAERTQLQEAISALQARWATEDAADQQRVKNESTQLVNTETKTKVRQLTHDLLKKKFWGYDKYETALAEVLATHGNQFNNAAAIKIELLNERHSRPSPQAFAAEVAREQQATGLPYDTAFNVVLERHRGLHSRPEMANEDLSDSKAAAVEFQKLIEAGWQTHPSFDRRSQSDYTWIFNSVARANPALMKRMHAPERAPANLWRERAMDAKAPAPSEA